MEPEKRILLWPLMRMAFLSYVTVQWLNWEIDRRATTIAKIKPEIELLAVIAIAGD